jgi:membrane-associated protease RseP (regulator of RpoE activity)
MKQIFFLFAAFLWVVSANAQNQENKSGTEEVKGQKIIIKKIIRTDGKEMTEAEIKALAEEELKNAGSDGEKREVRVFVTEGGQKEEILMDDDKRVIVIKGDGPLARNCMAEAKACCAKAKMACDPEKAVLGVVLREAGGNNGAAIDRVFEGSGAEKAGLKEGDIILKIDNKKIADVEAAVAALGGRKINDQVRIVYLRSGETEKTNATLGKCSPEMCMPSCKAIHSMGNGISKDLDIQMREQIKEGTSEIKQEAMRLKELAKELKKEIEMEMRTEGGSAQSTNESLELRYLAGYPNPNQGQLKVQYSGSKGAIQVSVIDLSGKELYSEKVPDFNGKYEKEINLEHTKGTVILKITQGDKSIQEKIIVE